MSHTTLTMHLSDGRVLIGYRPEQRIGTSAGAVRTFIGAVEWTLNGEHIADDEARRIIADATTTTHGGVA